MSVGSLVLCVCLSVLGLVGLGIGGSDYLSCNPGVGVWLSSTSTMILGASMVALSHIETDTAHENPPRWTALTLALILFGMFVWGVVVVSDADNTCTSDLYNYSIVSLIVSAVVSGIVIVVAFLTVWPSTREFLLSHCCRSRKNYSGV